MLFLDVNAELRVSILLDPAPDVVARKELCLLRENYTFLNSEVLVLLASSLVNLLFEFGVDSLGYLGYRSLILINLSMQTSPSSS